MFYLSIKLLPFKRVFNKVKIFVVYLYVRILVVFLCNVYRYFYIYLSDYKNSNCINVHNNFIYIMNFELGDRNQVFVRILSFNIFRCIICVPFRLTSFSYKLDIIRLFPSFFYDSEDGKLGLLKLTTNYVGSVICTSQQIYNNVFSVNKEIIYLYPS